MGQPTIGELSSAVAATQQGLQVSAKTDAAMWRLQAATIVFFMQVGFALVESGSVRAKNTWNIMIKNVMDACFCGVAFWSFGWAIGFGDGSRFIGWKNPSEKLAIFDAGDQVNWFFQYTFAATSATIAAGAVAERCQIRAYLIYVFIHSAFMYPMIAHFVWSNHGLMSARLRTRAFMGTDGVLDNAGSLVVHVTGGVASLVGAWMVGPRIGRFDIEGRPVPFKPNSISFVAAGTLILWAGFYGFNAGSVELSSQGLEVWYHQLARVCANTTLCAAFAGCTAYIATTRRGGSPPDHLFNAVLGGCVAACATSSIVDSWAAAVIGTVAGLIYLGAVKLMFLLEIDDPVHAIPVHLACGTWGGLSAGLFATSDGIRTTYGISSPRDIGVFYGGSGNLLGLQVLAILGVYIWVGGVSFILFGALDHFGMLRVPRLKEEVGLDAALHGGEDPTLRSRTKGDSRLQVGVDRPFSTMRKRFSRVSSDCLPWKGPSRRDRGGVWHKKLKKTAFGEFSFAMYEANYVMEDTSQVEASSSGVFMGVYDGHGGPEAAVFLEATLFGFLQQAMLAGGGVSEQTIVQAFRETEDYFTTLVRDEFEEAPHLACVGSCAVIALISGANLYVANCGDSRAVLAVREGLGPPTAVQLSVEHNLKVPEERVRYLSEHREPDVITETRGTWRVKGKLQVTRAFGNCYMKSLEFNRDPLFPRFRVPGQFTPPLITSAPHVVVQPLRPKDEFLILASDGLWEYIDNQEAVEIVDASPRQEIARHLVKIALQRAAQKHEVPYSELLQMSAGKRRDFHDDVTVIVFFFSHREVSDSGENTVAKVSGWQRTVSVVGGALEHGTRMKKSFSREGSGHKMENFTSLSGSRLEGSGHGRSNLTSPKGAKLEGSGHGRFNLASLSGTSSPRLEGSGHGRNNLTSMAGMNSFGSGRSWNNLTSLVGPGNERSNISKLDENL